MRKVALVGAGVTKFGVRKASYRDLICDEGNTALHAALAGRRDHRIVSRLLASAAEVNARAAGGYTPLHIAAFHDDLGVIETLLAHGAAADAREDQGRTPLAIAEDQGQKQVARRLRGEMP